MATCTNEFTHRQDSVVREEERVRDNFPRFVPGDILLIDEDAHELDDGERRVSIVELDGVVCTPCQTG